MLRFTACEIKDLKKWRMVKWKYSKENAIVKKGFEFEKWAH